MNDAQTPWTTVWKLFERFEDGLALMALFERGSGELLANGCPISEISDAMMVTERCMAEMIAERMCDLLVDPGWEYSHFYSATRGIDATDEDIERFLERSRQAGIQFEDRPIRSP